MASCDVPSGASRAVQDAALEFTGDLERRGGRGGGGLNLKTVAETAEARFSAAARRSTRERDVSERKEAGARVSVEHASARSDGALDDASEDLASESEPFENSDLASDDGADRDHVGAEDVALDSSQITRLFQNKRKCEEREQRRVAARLARLDTGGAFENSCENSRGASGSSAGVRAMTWEMKRAARDQIFSTSGAFQRLYSELFALQEKTDPACVCRVDAVDHDVHRWDVRFPAAAFAPGAGIREDLDLLEAVNGYGHVQVRVSFMPDLYPFYPPRVRVVRPRLKGIVASALAAHPAFHLRRWRPFTPAAAVAKFARDFLARCDARVDLECDGNDLSCFPDPSHGAYADHPSRLESALARLAACGTSRGSPITPAAYAAAYAAAKGAVLSSGETELPGRAARDSDDSDPEAGPPGSRTDAAAKEASSFADLLKEKDGDSGADAEGARAAAARNKEKRAETAEVGRARAWAKGTGYGYDAGGSGGGAGGGGSGGVNETTVDGGKSTRWDASAAREAQSAEDAVVQALVAETTALIRVGAGDGGKQTRGSEKKDSALRVASTSAPLEAEPSPAPELDDAATSDDAAPPRKTSLDAFADLFASMGARARVSRAATESAIRGSCLVAFAARELAGCAFMDMTARAAYYVALLDAVAAVARFEGCVPLLLGGGEAGSHERGAAETRGGVAASLREASRQARVYLRAAGAAGASAAEACAAADDDETERRGVSSSGDGNGASVEWAQTAAAEMSLARRIIAVHDAVRDAARAAAAGEDARGAAREAETGPSPADAAAGGPSSALRRSRRGSEKKDAKRKDKDASVAESDPESFTRESAYCEAMREHVFDVCAADPAGAASSANASGAAHAFAEEAARDLPAGPHLARIAREMAGLSATLPISRSSSALVRVDERRVVLWSVAVTGPEETPYDCGFFLFDAFFPSAYPAVAPKVKFKTTGGGRARMNPNLYQDGKVCLSLLGTWSGAKGETWDRSCSTMSQVIVSVQSLVFVAEPFFNEPGYERGIGTADGTRKSDEYNRRIREYTLRYAILEALRKPSAPFAAAIKEHFKRRRAYVLGPLRTTWLAKAAEGGNEHVAEMTRLFEEARVELEKL